MIVAEVHDPRDRPQSGIIIRNDTKWDLAVRSVVLDFGGPNSKPGCSIKLTYQGPLKSEYADHVLLKPGMEGAWVFPFHRIRYQPVSGATVEVEYKSPFGTTSVMPVRAPASSVGFLRQHLAMHYQQHNPLALPKAERPEIATALHHEPPSVADLVSAWLAAVHSRPIAAHDLRARFRLSDTSSPIDRSPELRGWLHEQARRILQGNDPAYVTRVAEIFAQKQILWPDEFSAAVLELLPDYHAAPAQAPASAS